MKRQGRQAESFCTAPDPDTAAALLFGKPGAPVEEFSEKLVQNWRKGASQPLDVKRISFEDVRSEPSILTDEMFSASLFGGASLFIATVNRESEAAPFLAALTDIGARTELPDGRLVLIAGDLNTRSKLRKAFEDSRRATALHFFERTPREFETWVRDWLQAEQVAIAPDAFQALVLALQDDPSLAASELSKLALFATDRDGPLSRSDISELISLEDQSSHFELIDLALDGNPAGVSRALHRLSLEATAIPVLIGLVSQLKRLSQAHDLSAQGLAGPRIGDRLAPRIFERQWPAFERRMQLWHTQRLVALLARIHDADMACRQAGSPQDAIVGQLLLEIARAAQVTKR